MPRPSRTVLVPEEPSRESVVRELLAIRIELSGLGSRLDKLSMVIEELVRKSQPRYADQQYDDGIPF